MFNLHTVYMVTLVSQATSALVLSLLAWADRRSRWLVPLAAACALHTAAIYLMPLWRGAGLWLPHALSAAILVAMLYLIHCGLQALVAPHRSRSRHLLLAVGAAMAVLFTLAYFSSLACTEAESLAAAVMLCWTSRMLWTGNRRELRTPLRATALLFIAILVVFLLRMPLEPLGASSSLLLSLREVTMLLFTLMAFSFLALYAAETRRRLHDESRTDVLTGLLNRRAMEEAAAEVVKAALRRDRPCALLVLDLDHFKRLNDTWGHDLGDRALIAAGELMLHEAEEVEQCHVARMGGEEFALLLPNSDAATALAFAERLRGALAALLVHVGEQKIRLTASIGVSVLQAGEATWTEMLRRADQAMYQAKREGRNRVMLGDEAPYDALGEEASRTACAH
jgi:diguanylate cyclase (GGDEF)-like protein